MFSVIILFIIAIILIFLYCKIAISIIIGDDFKEYPEEKVIIKGEFGEYNVKWRLYGMCFAHVIIRKIKNNKIIWDSCGNFAPTFSEASKMSKNKINKWFENVVNEYESGLKDGGYYK